jgi:hypothetical protein
MEAALVDWAVVADRNLIQIDTDDSSSKVFYRRGMGFGSQEDLLL